MVAAVQPGVAGAGDGGGADVELRPRDRRGGAGDLRVQPGRAVQAVAGGAGDDSGVVVRPGVVPAESADVDAGSDAGRAVGAGDPCRRQRQHAGAGRRRLEVEPWHTAGGGSKAARVVGPVEKPGQDARPAGVQIRPRRPADRGRQTVGQGGGRVGGDQGGERVGTGRSEHAGVAVDFDDTGRFAGATRGRRGG